MFLNTCLKRNKKKMKILAWVFLAGLIVAFAISTILSALDSTTGIDYEKTRPMRSPSEWPPMDSSLRNIFWMMQVSDIHISVYRDHARGPDLFRLCREYMSVINPEVVILTGDLTDAKDETNIVSTQNIKEWEIYHRIVNKCQEISQAKWLDIRGNHDDFDVLNYKSKRNHYKHYSVLGKPVSEEHQESYHYKHILPFGNYSFIGFDASVQPGSNRPFNFFGYLTDKQLQRLRRLSEESATSNHTIWFGHFPSSLIVHDPIVLRSVMRDGIAYLCGHLHTLANYVPHMFTRQKTGQLELELGDWKDNRVFRVIAFDHDLVSFVDAKLGDWPLVIITNPKNSQFYTPNKEPMEMVQYSTHIRVLVFNPDPINSVRVKIDGHDVGAARHVQGPLYVKEWDPQEYKGLHRIEVIVRDKAEREKRFSQYFSLHESAPEFEFLPRFLLMMNIFSLGKVTFGALVFSFTFVLTSLRQCYQIRKFYIEGLPVIGSLFNSMLVKVWMASQATSIYYICIGCILYLTFGPWFCGEMVRGHNGVVFAWGIVFQDAFVPSGITFFYGIFQVLTFNLPLLFLLGHILHLKKRHGHNFKFMKLSVTYMSSVFLFVLWVYITLKEFPTAYGPKALYLGPLRLGCVFIIPISIRMSLKHEFKTSTAQNGVH